MTQTDREIAEQIAKFRTLSGTDWKPLADDIETVLKGRVRKEDIDLFDLAREAGWMLCDGYCHDECD